MYKASVLLLLSLLLSLWQETSGQSIRVEGVVLSQHTGEGLPFVSIGIKHSIRGTSSDTQGRFSLQAGPEDTLVFSSVGYQGLQLAAREAAGKVYLQQSEHVLREVRVKPSGKLRAGKVGNTRGKTLVSTGGTNQYAMLLVPPASFTGMLEEISYELQPDIRRNDRWKTAVRIRVYANANGRPGQDLLPENLVLAIGKAEKQVVADVAAYAVVVPPEGVFVGLDLLGFFDETNTFIPYSRQVRPQNTRIPFTLHKEPYDTYHRFFGTEWQPVRHRHSSGQLVQVSARFSAKVLY